MPGPDRPVEDAAASPTDGPAGGPGAVDSGAIARLVSQAAAGIYGVAGVGGSGWRSRLAALLGRGPAGVRVSTDPRLRVELDLALQPGVPTAQVVGNVSDAVRYLVRRDLGMAIDELVVRVDGTAQGGA